jgi:hypothetical protein
MRNGRKRTVFCVYVCVNMYMYVCVDCFCWCVIESAWSVITTWRVSSDRWLRAGVCCIGGQPKRGDGQVWELGEGLINTV